MRYNLEKILPHKPPMILIDDIYDYDLQKMTLTAEFKPNPKKLFFDTELNGVNSLTGIEIMAQAVACLSYFKNEPNPPKPGLLLGSRLYNNNLKCFENNKEYKITVHEAFSDDEIAAFDCKIFDETEIEVQSACIKAYQGANTEEILKNG